MESDRSRQTIVVAGGAGFLGVNLCFELLSRGHTVLCLDNLTTGRPENLDVLRRFPHFRFWKADITQPLARETSENIAQARRIYNLACVASPPRYQEDPIQTLLTNVVGTYNLLELAARCKSRFLLASTSEVYGDPEEHPQSEQYRGAVSCIGPRACYDEGKRAAETLTFDYARTGRADVRVARLFNTYGPFMQPDDGRVVSNILSQSLRGEPLTVYGDGSQTRSFCFVSDVVDGLIRLMEADIPHPQPVNLGNPDEIPVLALAKLVQQLGGEGSSIEFRPLPVDDPKRRCPDISRARELLGWAPSTRLDQGIRQTYIWLDSVLNQLAAVG